MDTHGDKQRPLKAGKGDKRQFPPMNGEVKRLEMIIYIRVYIYSHTHKRWLTSSTGPSADKWWMDEVKSLTVKLVNDGSGRGVDWR